jgi:hypothetical protein
VYFSRHLKFHALRHGKNPIDILIIPDALMAYPNDAVEQSMILSEIIGTFNRLKLLKLKSLYEK